MLDNNHKTIGVFVTRAYEEYQDFICRAIYQRAYELGYNVAIFSNFVGYGEINYEIAESNIANIIRYQELDGIILLPDTLLVKDFESNIINNIEKHSTCPIVSVRQRREEYQNVLIEDDSVLDDIIQHFIKHHKFTKLNFLTGPKHNPVSTIRLNTYKRILAEHGIPIEEDRIVYGDFWREAGSEAVEKWLANQNTYLEAIICANDYMAIAVCNALARRGIMVPRDIAVSGCDNIGVTKDFSPTITTVGMPVFDMGREAVDKIHGQNMGKPQDDVTYLKFITYIRESCGCEMKKSTEEVFKRKNHIIQELEDRDDTISENAYMSIDLTGVDLLEDLNSRLPSYTNINSGYSSFYMCLYTDWDKYENGKEYDDSLIEREVSMELGLKNGELLQKVQFEARELLPSIYLDNEPQAFYFNMLHHREKCYGYTAISFKEFQAYKSSYQGWLTNVCNTLENIKISEDDEICIRMGGDEFSIIGVEYDKEKITRFTNNFEDAIRRFNEEQTYDFKISISYGWSITKADEETTLEECLSIADQRMYLHKYEKKRGLGK